MFIDFRERGKEKESQREKHQCEKETLISCTPTAPYVPSQGIKQASQVCALIGNQSQILLVHLATL